jgi:hypothetical protein
MDSVYVAEKIDVACTLGEQLKEDKLTCTLAALWSTTLPRS